MSTEETYGPPTECLVACCLQATRAIVLLLTISPGWWLSEEATAETAALRIENRVHAFYYPWYANPRTDSRWEHWNHAVMLREGGGKSYQPPEDIGANFYPQIGLYSSKDPTTVEAHVRQLRRAGVGVVCISWWGKGSLTDEAVPVILKGAEKGGIQVNFHIEPYPGRNAASVRDDIVYILDRYDGSSAFYRDAARGGRGMFYVYDSYLTPETDWATVLTGGGAKTIRGTRHDALVIALWVKEKEESFVLNGGFDGFYTYFATESFTYGSTPATWKRLSRWAKDNGKLFIPSVGPGYDDTRVRPWNTQNRRGREGGAYYDRMWQAAIDAQPDVVSITSFNEWHEGTQIEPAVPKTIPGYTYLDYSPQPPEYYLDRTKYWALRFERCLSK